MVSSPAGSSDKASPTGSSSRQRATGSFRATSSLKNPATQDVFQSIVKGRKSWKSFKGGEIVWPPELEAALIEGLENYQPDDSRETRLLGRFPMRNKFISDWIYEKTGKRRTAKQVGSRLQQLRDTCGGKKLLKLLSPIRPSPRTITPPPPKRDGHMIDAPSLLYDSESSSESSVSSPPTPTEAHATLQTLLYRGVEPRAEEMPNTVVYIDLLANLPPASITDEVSWTSSSEALAEENSWLERGFNVARASQQPRHLRDIEPTITFMSREAVSAQSHFTVHTDDGIVFSETTSLEVLRSSLASTTDNTLLYKTPLVPGFWDSIVHSQNAAKYIIVQRVVPDKSSSITSAPIFSAMYKFNYVELQSTPTTQVDQQQPNLPVHVVSNERADLGFDHFDFPIVDAAQSFNNMITFSKNQLFELASFTPEDWHNSSPVSVYPSPEVAPHSYNMIVDDHILSSPSLSSFPPAADLSTYGL